MKKFFITLLFVLTGIVFAQTSADELLKWKSLYDSGAITEEEYNIQKSKILEKKGTAPAASVSSVGDNSEILMTVGKLINDDLSVNFNKIMELSQALTYEQKMNLYRQFEKSAGGYFTLNLFLGFGVGSFVQGDKRDGFIQLGLEGSFVLIILYLMSSNGNNVAVLAPLGLGAYFGGYISGLVFPWVYANKYNETLKQGLGMSYKFSFAPIINPQTEQYGLMAKIKL